MATKAELEAKLKQTAEAKAAAGSKTLKNNTKGLRHVAGVKVLPGSSVELSSDQLKAVQANEVAMAWIDNGDLSLT